MSTNSFIRLSALALIPVMLAAVWGFYPSNKLESPADTLLDSSRTDYWNEGLAEISRYSLMQNRYKDVHPGEVVMIFVKEDFLTDAQVKNETYQTPNSTPVLKNIVSTKFTTGLYDYTLATNVFSPFDQEKFPGVLKTQSMSSEWCGTTYTQLNHRDSKYKIESRSYFEKEGDKNYQVDDAVLEDELFNLIRFDPKGLPTGTIDLIPSVSFSRMTHIALRPLEATADHMNYTGKEFDDVAVSTYKITFPQLNRTKTIYYASDFPHKILGWDDTYPSMFDKKLRTTKARLTHQIRNAYWNENKAEDADQRSSLGLSRY